MSPAIEKLSEALAKAQAEIKEAALDKENPHFHNPYATLASVWEACRKPLSDNGLSVTQVIGSMDGKPILRTVLMHSSGQWIESTCPLMTQQVGMQALGSAITYARRYSLAAIVGVAAGEKEEDDGNRAQGVANQNRRSSGKAAKQKQDVVIDPPPLPPGEYVLNMGKENKGKKLKDIDVGEVSKIQKFLIESPKALGKLEKETLDAVNAYLASLDSQVVSQ